MLERTVRELKGEPVEDEVSTAINLGVDIRIPEDYIYDMSQRLRTYKRISSAESDEELADVHAEIADRYGAIPETIENLFEYSRLRREASSLGIVSIDRDQSWHRHSNTGRLRLRYEPAAANLQTNFVG